MIFLDREVARGDWPEGCATKEHQRTSEMQHDATPSDHPDAKQDPNGYAEFIRRTHLERLESRRRSRAEALDTPWDTLRQEHGEYAAWFDPSDLASELGLQLERCGAAKLGLHTDPATGRVIHEDRGSVPDLLEWFGLGPEMDRAREEAVRQRARDEVDRQLIADRVRYLYEHGYDVPGGETPRESIERVVDQAVAEVGLSNAQQRALDLERHRHRIIAVRSGFADGHAEITATNGQTYRLTKHGTRYPIRP